MYIFAQPDLLQAETVVKAVQAVQHPQQQVQHKLCLRSGNLLTFSLLPHVVLQLLLKGVHVALFVWLCDSVLCLGTCTLMFIVP